MDWQMIGAVGEILGAGAVLATLIYVAIQVRHAKNTAQQRAVAEVLDLTQENLKRTTRDTDSARIWRLGMAADPSLTVDEQIVFRGMLYDVLLICERLYHLDRANTAESWIMEVNRSVRRDIIAAPGFTNWFEDRRHWLSSEYQTFLESELSRSGEYSPTGLDIRTNDEAEGLEGAE